MCIYTCIYICIYIYAIFVRISKWRTIRLHNAAIRWADTSEWCEGDGPWREVSDCTSPLSCLFMFVSYIKRCLFVGIKLGLQWSPI